MLTTARATVLSIDSVREDAQEMTVDVGGEQARAIAYTSLTGTINVGDCVLLNTTAVKLGLGTGGYHFVIANLSAQELTEQGPGHIIKCRYTPVQHSVLSVEEEDSPEREAIEKFQSLNGMPVVIGQLHSQLGPAAAGIKRKTQRRARVAYIMTDSAALPLAFSRNAAELKSKGIIDVTITVGQAFGGDIEAVNVYTGLIAAKEVARADAVVVCPGPGNVGTGTTYGFSSIEQGEIINAVAVLGGAPIAIARISFADPRPRHRGLSHHTVTALTKVALAKCTLVLPMIDQMKLVSLQEQIAHSAIHYKHRTRIVDGWPGIDELREKGFNLSSMGRTFEEDPEFFLSAAAAGALAGEMLKRYA
jgi:hypothetical protein